MVNKIAVMAVVLIVAVPILLGYGLAFEEVERTTWNESNTRSITSVLYNDTKYSDLALNSYSLNVDAFVSEEYYPYYMSVGTSPVTSYPLGQSSISANTSFDPLTYGINGVMYFDGNYPVNATITGAYIPNGTTVTETVSIASMTFFRSIQTNTLAVIGFEADSDLYTYFDVTSVSFDKPATIQYAVSSGSYADITYGWKFQFSTGMSIGSFTTAVMTMDLGESLNMIPLGNDQTFSLQPKLSGDANNHSYPLTMTIHRGSSAGESYLYVQGHDQDGNVKTATIPLDDSDFTKNVYQLLMNRSGYELRYVGSWPGTMALVQSLATWSFSMKYDVEPPTTFTNIEYESDTYLYESPIFRLDTAIREGFASPVITDKTYDPSVLMPDQATSSYSISLADIGYTGTSIGWGGQTFEVNKGAIVVDHKRIALSNLTLESKYLDGTRTNYINGKEISTGANTLQLNGTWGAIVSLTELTPETSTSNEWQPGEFAWNGVDSSFALMGLIASVGVFVGLGMYGARSGAKVGMLMLICGGAALIFLALI